MTFAGEAAPDDSKLSSSRWMDCDAYLFDIDGTLLNTRDGTHYHAFHHAVRDVFGVDSHIDGVPVHGNTDIGILRAVLRRGGISDAEIEKRLPAAIQQMCNEVEENGDVVHPELCPSVPELLEHLRRTGKLMGIVSGNLERIGWLKLRVAGIRNYFDFGCFSDNAEFRVDIFRNGLNEAQQRRGDAVSVCFVGDTPSDIDAARQLDLPVVAVATGIYSIEELLQHNPDVCSANCIGLLSQL